MFYKLFFEIMFKEIFKPFKNFSDLKKILLKKQTYSYYYILLLIGGFLLTCILNNLNNEVFSFLKLLLINYIVVALMIVLNVIVFFINENLITYAKQILKNGYLLTEKDFSNKKEMLLLSIKHHLHFNYNKEFIHFLIKNDFISKEEKDLIIKKKEDWNSYDLLEEILNFIYKKNNQKPIKEQKFLQQLKQVLLLKIETSFQMIEHKKEKDFKSKNFLVKIKETIKYIGFKIKNSTKNKSGVEDFCYLLCFFIVFFMVTSLITKQFDFFFILSVFTIIGFVFAEMFTIYYNHLKIEIDQESLNTLNIQENLKNLNNLKLIFNLYMDLEEKENFAKKLLMLNDKTTKKLQENLTVKNIQELRKLNIEYNDLFIEISEIILKKRRQNREENSKTKTQKDMEKKLKYKLEKLKQDIEEKSVVEDIKNI